jgi:hypothetical protein
LGSLILTDTRGIAFGPESDLESRRIALLKTHDHGLDLSRIACRTVELILTDILMVRAEVVIAPSSQTDLESKNRIPISLLALLSMFGLELIRPSAILSVPWNGLRSIH